MWTLSQDGNFSREPLQVIETGSYNFCRMAVYTSPASMLQQELMRHDTHFDKSQVKSLDQLNSNSTSTVSDDFQPVQHGAEVAVALGGSTALQTALQSAGTSLVAIAGHDPAILQIWNLQSGSLLKQLQQPVGIKHGMCMAVQLYKPQDSQSLYALVGYEDGEVAVWDVFQTRMLGSKHVHDEPVMAVYVDAAGTGGICAAADNKVHCFSLHGSSQMLALTASLEVKQQGIADICIRQDQRLFATAGWDGKIRVFHYRKHKALAVLQYHKKGLTALAFHPKDQRLISASRDSNIALWSVFQSDGT